MKRIHWGLVVIAVAIVLIISGLSIWFFPDWKTSIGLVLALLGIVVVVVVGFMANARQAFGAEPKLDPAKAIDAEKPVPPLPHLNLKIFKMKRRLHAEEIEFVQDKDPVIRVFIFGFALVNSQPATIAKEIDIRVEVSWRGNNIQSAPKVSYNRYHNEGWQASMNLITNSDPAVLTFHGLDQERCAYGQPLEWNNFNIELQEEGVGYFLIQYTVSSSIPVTSNIGELRITLLSNS